MKDIKMSECFSLPLVVVTKRDYCGEYESAIHDSFDDFMFFVPDDIDDKALIQAVNNHDLLVDQLDAAKAEIAELKSDMKFMCEMYPYHGFTTAQYDKMVSILAKHKGE